ncbi:DUF1566 domain-containing protein [Methyloprofundus sp.]|uniref:Lcl C-terminal domain-containing protein n=1 Tax=Methyloprofundus sp. TaxID=2020875 RepID=UPI003D1311C1
MRYLTIIIFGLYAQIAASQTHCYDLVKIIPCGSADFPRQTGDYAVADKEPRFSIVQAGIIKDKETGLQWLQCISGAGLNDCINPEAKTWEQAKQSCAIINVQQQQWRLPTIMELNSLIELDHKSIKINTDFFPDTQKAAYWTNARSLTYKTRGSRAWFVDFAQASIFDAPVKSKHFVHCVSAGSRL